MYDTSDLDDMVGPHQCELLDLYYAHAHPTLPILECRPAFDAAIAARTVPTSLLAAIYGVGVFFWDHSPTLKGQERVRRKHIYEYIFKMVALEARTPSLRTIQAILIFLHLPPNSIREPNHPGFWALTCQVSCSSTLFRHDERNRRMSSEPGN